MADDSDLSGSLEEIYPPEGIAPPHHRKAPHGDKQRGPKELHAVQPPPKVRGSLAPEHSHGVAREPATKHVPPAQKQSGAPNVAQVEPPTNHVSHGRDEVHHAPLGVTQGRLKALPSTGKHVEHGITHKTKEPPASVVTQVASIAHKPVHGLPSGMNVPVQHVSAVSGGALEAERKSDQGAHRTPLSAASSSGRRSSDYNSHAESVAVQQEPQSQLQHSRTSFGSMDAWANTDLPALQVTTGLEPAAQGANVRSRKLDHYLGIAPRPVAGPASTVLATCASMAQAFGLVFMVLVVGALCVAVFYVLDNHPYLTSNATESPDGLHLPTVLFTDATEASALLESAAENEELANRQATAPYSTDVTPGDGDTQTSLFIAAAPRVGAPKKTASSMPTPEAVTMAPQGSTTREALTRSKKSEQRMQALKPGVVVEDFHPTETTE